MLDVNAARFWQKRYQNQQFPWDLGEPTPVFARLAANGRFPPGRMIVLGAGHGHDARLFARHGFDVTAVDFADAAVQAMQQLAAPDAPVTVLQADFFQLSPALFGQFDIVLEYTCFCAIDPARRPEFAALVQRLLKPGGLYVTLAFPIGRRSGGPPFVVQPDAIVDLFYEHNFKLLHREFPPDSVPARKGVEELLILQKHPLPT